MNMKCPWCDREMHLDSVKQVYDTDNTSMAPGVYHVLHCVACRRTYHQMQVPQKEAVKV